MVDTNKPIRFYDDRGKCLEFARLTEKLFENKDVCLCKVDDGQTVLFSKKSGEVLTDNYFAWYATNDWAGIEAEFIRIKEENA